MNATTDQLYSFKDTSVKPAVWTSKGFDYLMAQVNNRTADCMNNYYWPEGHPNHRKPEDKLDGPCPDGCIMPSELMKKKGDFKNKGGGPKKITLKKL